MKNKIKTISCETTEKQNKPLPEEKTLEKSTMPIHPLLVVLGSKANK